MYKIKLKKDDDKRQMKATLAWLQKIPTVLSFTKRL
jgi:hypothetical protein